MKRWMVVVMCAQTLHASAPTELGKDALPIRTFIVDEHDDDGQVMSHRAVSPGPRPKVHSPVPEAPATEETHVS